MILESQTLSLFGDAMMAAPLAAAPAAAAPAAVTSPAGRIGKAGGVRRLERDDIPQLCVLFSRTFRAGRRPKGRELAVSFEDIYLTGPGDRHSPASLVDVAPGGRVNGFMGIITLAARLDGVSLRGGMLGNFMADEADRAQSAMRLMRATLAQDLDFIFSDTANQTSLALSCALKFNVLPVQSLEWFKILRPAATAAVLLGKSAPALATIIAPLARVADVAGRRAAFAARPDQRREGIVDRPIEAAAFMARAPALVERFRLRPDWNAEELGWLLDRAGRKNRNGAMRLREVVDRAGTTLGLYILYARAGGVAQALQVLARRGQDGAVLTELIRHADDLGAVAVRGTSSPALVEALIRQSGILYHHVAASVLFTRRPDLRAAVLSGDAATGGLMGESWTQLVADEFA